MITFTCINTQNDKMTTCQNILKTTCQDTTLGKRVLRRFIRQNTRKNGSLSLNKQVPQPKCENHRLFNWGCRNDIRSDSQLVTVHTETVYEINFDTEDGLCEQWLTTITKIYPSLDFELRYSEISNDYSGIIQTKNGVKTRDDFGNYLSFCPIHYVNCPVCEEECHFDFDIDDRDECKSLEQHIGKYDCCWKCTEVKFQRFWSKNRIRKFMEDNINHVLYRYPDGIRLPDIKANFNTNITQN